MNRPVRKIAFVSPHCAIDFTNGAATATLDALVFLQSLGFQCQVFCSTRSDSWEEDRMESVLAERGMPCLVRDARIGRYRGRMIFTAYRSGSESSTNSTTPLACASGLDRSAPTALTPCPSPGRRGEIEALTAGPFLCSPLTAPGSVPVTLFNSASSRGWRDREEIAAFVTAGEIFLRSNRPDLVWTYGGDAVSRRLHQIVRQLGIPLVFELHNFAYSDCSLFAATDRVIVPTEFARQYYRERLGLECQVLPLVVDENRVKAERTALSPHPCPLPQGEGTAPPDPLPEGEGTFVTFVNPTPLKGVFIFARIAEVLSRRRPDIPLLIVEGSCKVRHLPELGIDISGIKNLRIMPNTPDARKFYAVSKLLLMPSLVENAGFIAMEAMTNGIPVLASNRGGLPETIGGSPLPGPLPEGEGSEGFLLDIPARYTPETREAPTAEEVEPWVETIIRLWDDASYYEHWSRAARQRAKCWHPDRLAPLYQDFFSRIAPLPAAAAARAGT